MYNTETRKEEEVLCFRHGHEGQASDPSKTKKKKKPVIGKERDILFLSTP